MNKKKFKLNIMVNKELKKNLSKFIILNKNSTLKSDKIIKIAYKNFYFYKYSSVSFFRRSCVITLWSRSVFRFFKLCRYSSRLNFSKGLLMGIRLASF